MGFGFEGAGKYMTTDGDDGFAAKVLLVGLILNTFGVFLSPKLKP